MSVMKAGLFPGLGILWNKAAVDNPDKPDSGNLLMNLSEFPELLISENHRFGLGRTLKEPHLTLHLLLSQVVPNPSSLVWDTSKDGTTTISKKKKKPK